MSKGRLYNYVEKNIALVAKAPRVTVHNIHPLVEEPKVCWLSFIAKLNDVSLFIMAPGFGNPILILLCKGIKQEIDFRIFQTVEISSNLYSSTHPN